MLELNEEKLLYELQYANDICIRKNSTYYVVMRDGCFYTYEFDELPAPGKLMWRFDNESDEVYDWIFSKGIENARDCIFEVYEAHSKERYGNWDYDANPDEDRLPEYLEELYNLHDEAIRSYYSDLIIDEKDQSGYYSEIIEQIKRLMAKGVACATLY